LVGHCQSTLHSVSSFSGIDSQVLFSVGGINSAKSALMGIAM
jgi:hypothetical protein